MTRLLLAIALVAIVAAGIWIYARGWAPGRDDYPVQGVSVDANQGALDWGTLAARDVDFAYIRATQGDRLDRAFAANWQGARAAGLRYGAILDFSLCRLASDQATRFITSVPRDNAALPPALRLAFDEGCKARPSRQTLLAEIGTLVAMVESHAGKPLLVNVTPDFDKAYDIGFGINRTLWLDGDFFPPDYASRRWVMWTANGARHIDGIDGPIRWDVVAP
ncbi:MAG: GH25 family lysozyme [Sphingobium sp.]